MGSICAGWTPSLSWWQHLVWYGSTIPPKPPLLTRISHNISIGLSFVQLAPRRELWDFSGNLQDYRDDKMKSPLAIALGFVLVLCSLRMVETSRQHHCGWFETEVFVFADIWTSLPSETVPQTFSQPVTHTFAKKAWVYTMTVESPTILPSSLVIDTSQLPSSFAFAPSSNSNYATRAYLSVLVIIAAPAAMLLPQINVWAGIWEVFVGLSPWCIDSVNTINDNLAITLSFM